jgi:hypothetical protein
MQTDRNKRKMRLSEYGHYPSVANCWLRIPAIFGGMSKSFITYSTISRETPNNVPRNPGWEHWTGV